MPERSTRAELDSYQPPLPSADLVDRIMRAVEQDRARGAGRAADRPGRRGARRFAIAALAAAATLAGLLLWRANVETGPGQGWRVISSASSRQELALGSRALAVVHEGASLRWPASEEVSAVEQERGVVVYSVKRGGPFSVRVPGGRVEVLGTRFNVEVKPMSSRARRASVGAAALAVTIVAVYQGRVLLSSSAGELALAAGEVGSFRPGAPPRRHAATAAEAARARTGWARTFASRQARQKLAELISAAQARRSAIPSPGAGAGAASSPAAGQPAGGAEAPSGSLPKEYIQATIKEALPLVKECYELALNESPDLHGKLIARFTIVAEEEAGGLVELVEIEGQDPVARHPALAECIRETIYSLEFPRPEGGGRVKVSYPFRLNSARR